jgi:MSHA pilin protein MshA
LRQVSGFTLIELVITLSIVAVLAATALPKFVNLQSDARTASASSVAGAISSASAINYAARLANSTGGVATANTCTTTALKTILTGGVMPNDILLSGTATSAAATQGSTGTCTVSHSAGGTTSTATLIFVT